MRCSRLFSLMFIMVSNQTYLKMRVSKECFLHVRHLEIALQILSSRRISSFILKDFLLGCNDKGSLLLLPRPPLLSKRPGFSRFVEATVTRCTLEDLTFVSTLFESCEPYSWYSTVGLENWNHILSKFSSFLRNYEPYFTSPSTTYQNSFGNTLEHSMMVLVLGDNFEFFLPFLNGINRQLLCLWLYQYWN